MTDPDPHDGQPESVFGEVGEYIVFLRDGTVSVDVDEEDLHGFTRREDYGFALTTGGVEALVTAICEEHSLSPSLYGNLIEEAVVRGAIAAGWAALMTLDTQHASDEKSNRKT